MQCLECRAVDSIKKSATLKNNFMMRSLLSQDLIVLEEYYHKSCFREYTQKVQNIFCEVLREIVKEYYEQIIEVPKVSRCIFSSKNIIMRDSTIKYLQRNLKKVNFIIFKNIEGKLYVYWTSLTTKQLVILYVNNKTDLHQLKKTDGNNDITHLRNAAKPIRKNIWNFKILFVGHLNLRIWNLKTWKLNLIMISLLNDEDEQLSHTDRLRGQDTYAATKRSVRTPKIILLPFMFKTLTK